MKRRKIVLRWVNVLRAAVFHDHPTEMADPIVLAERGVGFHAPAQAAADFHVLEEPAQAAVDFHVPALPQVQADLGAGLAGVRARARLHQEQMMRVAKLPPPNARSKKRRAKGVPSSVSAANGAGIAKKTTRFLPNFSKNARMYWTGVCACRKLGLCRLDF